MPLWALVAAFMLGGCKPSERVVYVPKVHNVVTTIYAHDTVVVVKVPDTYAERVTKDTISELSTPFAWSRAEVSGGMLSHSLGTHGELPTSVTIEEKIITRVDSIPYPVEIPVYVDKELRWWQRSLMWAGGISIGLMLVVAAYRLGIQR